MKKEEISKKSEQLNILLVTLAQSENLLSDKNARKDIYKELEDIYYSPDEDGFRHYYSDIFAQLFEIRSDESSSNGSTNILLDNLRFLNEHYKAINTDKNGKIIDVGKSINKLYDHVNLELARMAYSEIGDYQLSEQGMTLNDLSEKVSNLQKDADDIHRSLDKAQADYIAILGIFASVVLTFVGGMAFSTSVLENIKGVSIYRLLIVALVIGIVFVTVIFFMFYFVGVLARQKLFNLKTCIPLGIVYLIFGILTSIVFIMWQNGTVELRDDEIRKHFESIESEAAETSAEPDVTSQIYFEQNNATIE
jgi:hypothetical protein